MRVSSESEKKEWMEMLKERATGSLANRRRISATPATGGDSSKVHMPHLNNNNNNNSTLINTNAIACVFTGETILHGLGHGVWE